MGFLVSSGLLLLSSVPFWFLPRSLPTREADGSAPASETLEGADDVRANSHSLTLAEIAKGMAEVAAESGSVGLKFSFCSAGFLPSLKRLLGTPAYVLLLCDTVLKFNSMIGLFTFIAKYMEQQFGQSASRANFLIGELVFVPVEPPPRL